MPELKIQLVMDMRTALTHNTTFFSDRCAHRCDLCTNCSVLGSRPSPRL